MPTFLTTYENYFKIAVILIYTAFIWHCHTIYDNANETALVKQELKQAQNGQNEIIKFHSNLSKLNVKDPCYTTNTPIELNKLLK